MVSPFQILSCLCKSSVDAQHIGWAEPQGYLNCGSLSFPETSEEHVLVVYQSGEASTGFQYLRYFTL